MTALFERFPYLAGDSIIIRQMTEDDVDALGEITGSERMYRCIPPFLYNKSRKELLTAIRNCAGRDFDKHKFIIAGIYMKAMLERLVGLAEMFDYHQRRSQITIGYRLNEQYWHQGIATEAIDLMKRWLLDEIGVSTLMAYVMPENVYSAKALLKNGFRKLDETTEGKSWGGQAVVTLDVYTCDRGSTAETEDNPR